MLQIVPNLMKFRGIAHHSQQHEILKYSSSAAFPLKLDFVRIIFNTIFFLVCSDVDDGSSSSSSPMTRSLNVFQRLSSVPGTAPILPTKGSVLPFVASLNSNLNNNLTCAPSRRSLRSRFGTSSLCCELVATGHAAAVKSIFATEDLLVSGSKGLRTNDHYNI